MLTQERYKGILEFLTERDAATVTELAQAVGIAQNVPAQGMLRKKESLEVIENQLAGRVIIALYLIDHDLHLLLHLVLGIGAVENDIHQQVDGSVEMLSWEGAVVDRLLLARIGIQVTSHTLHPVYDVPSLAPLGSFEGQVFCEMGDSRFLILLISRTAIHGNSAVHHIGGTGRADNA